MDFEEIQPKFSVARLFTLFVDYCKKTEAIKVIEERVFSKQATVVNISCLASLTEHLNNNIAEKVHQAIKRL